MKISKEIKVGAGVLISLACLIYGYNFLKGEDIFSSSNYYYVMYSKVDGLTKDNPVFYNGFQIGKVQELQLSPIQTHYYVFDKNNKKIARDTLVFRMVAKLLILNKEIKIPQNTVAKIESTDLMGSKGISLQFARNQQFCESGDTLIGDIQQSLQDAVNAELVPLKNKAEGLVGQIDSVIQIIDGILNQRTQDNVVGALEHFNNSLLNIENLTDTFLNTNAEKLSKSIDNVYDLTNNFNESSENFKRLVNNMADISDTVKAMELITAVDNFNTALEDMQIILNRLKEGEGTLGLMLKDDSLYIDLQQSMMELDKLVEDIRVNPERYIHVSVFGKSEKEKNKPKKKDRKKVRPDLKD